MSSKKTPWKQFFTFLTPRGVEHEVSGRSLRFYPISPSMLIQLRHFAEPIADAVIVMLTPTRQDSGTQVEQIDDLKENCKRSVTTMEAVSPELAKLRSDQKRGAMQNLINAFLDDNSRQVMGMLIMDSLRDNFERNEITPEESDRFLELMDSRAFVEFLMGMVKANKEVFGPLGLDSARELLAKRLSEEADARSAGANLRLVSNGETSPMPTSSPSPEVTPPSGS